jgi:hypothetical protein
MEEQETAKKSKQKKSETSVTVKVQLPMEVHRRIKVISVLRGYSIQKVVATALEEWIDTQDIKSLL